jgi:hypothetical protein
LNPKSPKDQPSSAEATGGKDAATRDDAAAKKVAAEQLNTFAESGKAKTLLDAFDHHFGGEFSQSTYEDIWDSGSLLVGAEGFGAIAWAADDDSREKIDLLNLTPGAEELVIHICALYGSRLKRAYQLSKLFEKRGDDWESYGRRIYRLVTGEGYLIETSITKYNGEKLTLSGGLPSVLRLAAQALKTLVVIDDLSEIEDRDREQLKEFLDAVATKLAPEEQSATVSDDE